MEIVNRLREGTDGTHSQIATSWDQHQLRFLSVSKVKCLWECSKSLADQTKQSQSPDQIWG